MDVSWESGLFQHLRKTHHPDQREAERERRRLSGISVERAYACYRCPVCGQWVVGSRGWSER